MQLATGMGNRFCVFSGFVFKIQGEGCYWRQAVRCFGSEFFHFFSPRGFAWSSLINLPHSQFCLEAKLISNLAHTRRKKKSRSFDSTGHRWRSKRKPCHVPIPCIYSTSLLRSCFGSCCWDRKWKALPLIPLKPYTWEWLLAQASVTQQELLKSLCS